MEITSGFINIHIYELAKDCQYGKCPLKILRMNHCPIANWILDHNPEIYNANTLVTNVHPKFCKEHGNVHSWYETIKHYSKYHLGSNWRIKPKRNSC